jgi:hypothetical protein
MRSESKDRKLYSILVHWMARLFGCYCSFGLRTASGTHSGPSISSTTDLFSP